MEPFLSEFKVLVSILLFFVGIWLVAEYWETFKPIFLFLLLIFVIWFFWIGFSDGGNRDNDADEGSDY